MASIEPAMVDTELPDHVADSPSPRQRTTTAAGTPRQPSRSWAPRGAGPTLDALGYVTAVPSGGAGSRYRLAAKVLELGYAAVAAESFAEIVQPYSCSLAVLDRDAAVFLARAAVRHVMTIRLMPGTRVPALASAVSRAVLSGLSPDELAAYLQRHPPVQYTEHTVTDPGLFAARIAEARERGWALIDQELESGVRSVAVPVHDATGTVVAAVTIGTHTGQVTEDTLLTTILPRLQECVAMIERTVTTRPLSAMKTFALYPTQSCSPGMSGEPLRGRELRALPERL